MEFERRSSDGDQCIDSTATGERKILDSLQARVFSDQYNCIERLVALTVRIPWLFISFYLILIQGQQTESALFEELGDWKGQMTFHGCLHATFSS